jgi:glutamine amidotransferase
MRELSARRLTEPIKAHLASGKPYLGICLGLQLLFERSEEGSGAAGLGILPGVVKRFADTPGLKIPHMGWNQVYRRPETGGREQSSAVSYELSAANSQNGCPLLQGIPDGSFVYFVHSYYPAPVDRAVVALETDYGGPFAAMVWRGSLFATQFHPEKSQAVGLRILKNFVDWRN